MPQSGMIFSLVIEGGINLVAHELHCRVGALVAEAINSSCNAPNTVLSQLYDVQTEKLHPAFLRSSSNRLPTSAARGGHKSSLRKE